MGRWKKGRTKKLKDKIDYLTACRKGTNVDTPRSQTEDPAVTTLITPILGDMPSSPSKSEKLTMTTVFAPETEELPELVVEIDPLLPKNDPGLDLLKGNMIVDARHFIVAIRMLERHRCPISSLGFMSLKNVRRLGLITSMVFICSHCSYEMKVFSEPQIRSENCRPTNEENQNTVLNINTKTVWGSLAIGIGHDPLEELLSVMGIFCLSSKSFSLHEERLGHQWQKILTNEMEAGITEEIELARTSSPPRVYQENNSQYAWTIAIVDGGWSQRSYGHRYSAKSGCAIIIGFYTKRILYLGVRNKFCSVCNKFEANGLAPKQHTCFRNWSGSSTAMEADIIVEGFRFCEEHYNLRFKKFVGDGDSSVHASIISQITYGRTVEKIECANHVVKNLTKNLYAMAKGDAAKHLSKSRIAAISRCSRGAISLNKGNERQLVEDIKNVPDHVFGSHKQCRIEFCYRAGTVMVPCALDNLPRQVLMGIRLLVERVGAKAQALTMDLTSNQAEMFMSLVAKSIGGKQINRSQQGSYSRRVSAAGLNFQLRHKWCGKTMKQLTGTSPSMSIKRLQEKRERKRDNCRRRLEMGLCKPKKKEPSKPHGDVHYGLHSTQPPAHGVELEQLKYTFLTSISLTEEEILQIEEDTKGQRLNHLWMQERRQRLTASHFGTVCKMRGTTSCRVTVRSIIYQSSLQTPAIRYGIANEGVAISEYEKMTNLKVDTSGLVIDRFYNFLAASPDGVIGQAGLIEVKCPYNMRDRSPHEANLTNMFTVVNGKCQLKHNHNYYYQVQGQLHITKRLWCDFVIWTPKGMVVERIEKDDRFWKDLMEAKLVKFYKECLLPELADPCHTRGHDIREAAYFENFQNTCKKRKTENLFSQEEAPKKR